MSELVISPERTPNPNAMKFSANRQLNPGPARCYYDAAGADADPAASRIFALPGVTGVMILGDFCSVNQDGSTDWAELIPKIEAILQDAYAGSP